MESCLAGSYVGLLGRQWPVAMYGLGHKATAIICVHGVVITSLESAVRRRRINRHALRAV